MNNNNMPAVLRSLIVYAVCIPLAVWLGFLLADPLDRSTFSYFGIMALILCAPILLRWHHFLMVCVWNVTMTIFFLPGAPMLWLPMVAISFGISVLHRSLNSEAHFISAPQIARPLIFLLAVIFFTAEMTGGFGMKALGSSAVGGKRYIFLIVAIVGYFALTAKRIPPKKAGLYVALFFIGGFTVAFGDLASVFPSSLSFFFAFFPASMGSADQVATGREEIITRFSGVGNMAIFGFWLMLARYGVRGIFMAGRLWRVLVFALFSILLLMGGFRSLIIQSALIFFFLFFLERMQRTWMLPAFILAGLVAVTLIVPFANKLPNSFQRSLAFLPLNIDPVVRMNAEASSDWRWQIWKAVLPQVPEYLLVGKGYYTSSSDFEQNNNLALTGGASAADWGAAQSGNYHSGPLSVAIFFGIWGIIGVLWFFIAGIMALYDNYRYGDPSLHTINTLLFALFVTRIIIFLFIFGSLFSDMVFLTGMVGLSVSLNGGIRRPARAPRPAVDRNSKIPLARPRFQPFYPR